MPPLLELRGLRVLYGRAVALEGIDLAVPPGSVVSLLGPNGAGKSTLLHAVAGTVQPRAGSIAFRGREISGLPAHERTTLGLSLLPEGRGIFADLSVWENLRIALGDDPDAIGRAVERFPVLGDRRRQQAGTLSGGEQQMLALARTVGRAPDLLLVDEPSLGLAPRLVSEIMEVLERLHREEGRTILLVEQYAAHALRLADFVYVLRNGRIVWAGEPAELEASTVLQESYLGREASA